MKVGPDTMTRVFIKRDLDTDLPIQKEDHVKMQGEETIPLTIRAGH